MEETPTNQLKEVYNLALQQQSAQFQTWLLITLLIIVVVTLWSFFGAKFLLMASFKEKLAKITTQYKQELKEEQKTLIAENKLLKAELLKAKNNAVKEVEKYVTELNKVRSIGAHIAFMFKKGAMVTDGLYIQKCSIGSSGSEQLIFLESGGNANRLGTDGERAFLFSSLNAHAGLFPCGSIVTEIKSHHQLSIFLSPFDFQSFAKDLEMIQINFHVNSIEVDSVQYHRDKIENMIALNNGIQLVLSNLPIKWDSQMLQV